MKYLSISIVLLALVSCGKHYVGVIKVPVDRSSLASTYVRSPDPKQINPPSGEKLYVNWKIPFAMDPSNYFITLSVIYRDLSEENVVYPLNHRLGTIGFELLGSKFEERKGFYSYKAELTRKDGEVLDEWRHIMWVKVLH